MAQTSNLPYRVADSRASTMTQRSRRYDDDDDALGLPTTMQIPKLPSACEQKPRNLPWHKINWQTYSRSGNPALLFWLSVMFGVLLFFTEEVEPRITSTGADSIIIFDGSDRNQQVRILFEKNFGVKASGGRSSSSFNLSPLPKAARGHRNFGDLTFERRGDFSDPIPIQKGNYYAAESQRQDFLEAIDDSHDAAYQPGSSTEDEDKECRLVSWAAYSFPTCNKIHETPIERYQDAGYDVSYLK